MGDKKLINEIPPKIPGQSHEHFVYVFFLYVLFAPYFWLPFSYFSSGPHWHPFQVVSRLSFALAFSPSVAGTKDCKSLF